MKTIHIKVNEKILEFIDKITQLGFYPNRSEAIRAALKSFVSNESKFLSDCNQDIVKLNDIHKRFVEFDEAVKAKLYPAYFPIEKKVI